MNYLNKYVHDHEYQKFAQQERFIIYVVDTIIKELDKQNKETSSFKNLLSRDIDVLEKAITLKTLSDIAFGLGMDIKIKLTEKEK